MGKRGTKNKQTQTYLPGSPSAWAGLSEGEGAGLGGLARRASPRKGAVPGLELLPLAPGPGLRTRVLMGHLSRQLRTG